MKRLTRRLGQRGAPTLLERVRGLAGHRLPSGDLMTLLKRGLEAYERELEKERFAVGRKTRRSNGAKRAPRVPASPDTSKSELAASDVTNSNSAAPEVQADLAVPAVSESKLRRSPKRKHYPTTVLREVFLRDGEQCSYVSPDGRRCGARRCLELDHVTPFAVGGAATVENLRLRCRAHNQRHARLFFGKACVDAALRSSRRRRAVAQVKYRKRAHAREPSAS